jgi:hypothetical protein
LQRAINLDVALSFWLTYSTKLVVGVAIKKMRAMDRLSRNAEK